MTTAKNDRRAEGMTISALNDSNYSAVKEFLCTRNDRPRSDGFEQWRYRECPTMRALVAEAGDKCIATMFALRRRYRTPVGEREFLEPFEWHSSEEWRALAPGLRLVKRYMKEMTPMITVAGTDMAAGLFTRLKWTAAGMVNRYALPLSGRFLSSRGHGKIATRVFDIVGRRVFTPRRSALTVLGLEAANSYAPAVASVANRQSRFGFMRMPDRSMARWLQQAPASVGHYFTLHARLRDELVGWVTARSFYAGGIRVGELLEVFLSDDCRSYYQDLVSQSSVILAGFGVDVLLCTTTCPDTQAALKRLRFHLDDTRPVFMWWGEGKSPPAGMVLVDGAIADHSFFPLPTSSDVTWLDSRREADV